MHAKPVADIKIWMTSPNLVNLSLVMQRPCSQSLFSLGGGIHDGLGDDDG